MSDLKQHSEELPPALIATPREDVWCHEHHEALNAKASRGGFEVMLLGDSITWEWEANEATGAPVWLRLERLRAATFGVSGDRTEHLLWRLENGNLLTSEAPRAVVLLIGTNNIGQRGDAPAAIAAGVVAILQTVKARFPAAKLILYGIFPRVGAEAAVDATNTVLREEAGRLGVEFVSLNAALSLPDGSPDLRYFRDGLHLSAHGYEVWAESLLTIL